MEDGATGDDPLDVIVQHASLEVDPELCRRVLMHVFDIEEIDLRLVTLIQADHVTVRQLNRSYLEHDYETDVLAFPYSDEGEALEGEIYIDLDTAAERHEEFGATLEQEALRYAVHGALHLVGYCDEEREGKEEMHRLEDRYLSETGVLGSIDPPPDA